MHEAELRKLFDMYYLPVMRYLSHLTGEATAAQDLSQEVFLKLYYYGPSKLENPRAWLFRVATNLGYNYLRQRGNRMRRETAADNVQQERHDLEDLAIRSEERINVHQVLESLSERDRTCLIMRFSGFSYQEIAEVIGVSKNSVGTILLRAMRRFRREYENRGEK
ncbi:MAG: sigma-70 family RNA polymerase sigma factor [Syntrophomonadaceae bacterium]|nr:sigma-70 family RNA polymerase sigma factor [Syntrophomonadaceae bacterium]